MRIQRTFAAAAAFALAMAASTAGAQSIATAWAPQPKSVAEAPSLSAVEFTGVELPALPPSALESLRAINAVPGRKALQIGVGREIEPAPQAAALQWLRIGDTWVAQWRLRSPGAAGLRVVLQVGSASASTEFVFAGQDGRTYGPFRAGEDAISAGEYWSPVLEGEIATIELRSAAGAPPADIVLVRASHLFATPWQSTFGDVTKAAGACEVDVICSSASDAALASAASGVARIAFSDASGSFLCSGTLLNSSGAGFIPYFHTAAHCIGTQAAASTLTSYWFYERSGCNTGGTSAAATQVPGGAQLLYADPGRSDVSMVRLNGTPPAGAAFVGWDASSLPSGAAVTGIHHPAGDWKKVSQGASHGFTGTTLATGSFIDVVWSSGVTEGGSSGSGIFTRAAGSLHFRGGLLGGASQCTAPTLDDVYSRFDLAYPILAQWLSPASPPPVISYTLTVSKDGAGSGTVSSTPSGIACGATCLAPYIAGTTVTLTATPTVGSTFAGWSGACSGTGGCAVTMNAAASVNATFTSPPPALSVSTASIDFAGQLVGTTSAAQAIVLRNTGGGTLAVTGFSIDTTFPAINNCHLVIAGGSCMVLVAFAPTAAAGFTGSVSLTTNAGTAAVMLSGVGRASLVDDFYASILRRPADGPGKAFWESEAQRISAAQGNVNEAWYALAIAFFSSPEYLAFGRVDAEFVTDLYHTFFKREPDAGGLDFWVGQIAAGMPRNVVLVSFLFSPEFAAYTHSLYGDTAARPEIDAVMDAYRGFLSRLPDTAGLSYWTQQFKIAQCQGAPFVAAQAELMSRSFALGGEYAARQRGNADYVGDLYNAYLRRGGDLAGVAYWIDSLAQGRSTREQVRQQFAASPEFSGRVSAIVAAGCLAQARRLMSGTWTLNYLLGTSGFSSSFKFTSVPVSTSASPELWYAAGTELATGRLVTANFVSASRQWTLLEPGASFDQYFVFGFDDDNHVTGCYYQITPAGSTNLGSCLAMSGTRSPPI